jgi:hypothetical protein
MFHYSLRVLSEAGRIVRRYDFQATSDDEARGAARVVLGASRGELRAGSRIVCHWEAPFLKAAS